MDSYQTSKELYEILCVFLRKMLSSVALIIELLLVAHAKSLYFQQAKAQWLPLGPDFRFLASNWDNESVKVLAQILLSLAKLFCYIFTLHLRPNFQ